ncbi:hypothetical protein KBD68_01155 [Candidatus Woesebacteria bacterium]|nr:hypothetical protein [Candidatus Woesebacteria bacterium]
MDENHSSGFWWGVILSAAIYFIFLRAPAKYEGLTAEEWFNEYDATTACLENIQSEASYAQGENYATSQNALEEIESETYSCL